MQSDLILGYGLRKMIPRFSKRQLDDIAEAFVEAFYPEAFETTTYIDMDVVYERLGLNLEIIQLNEDFEREGVFGMCCFTHGLVHIFDPVDEFIDYEVEPGTVLIDPNSYLARNEGCFNNTKAHEAVHWVFHRGYYSIQPVEEEEAALVACRDKRVQSTEPKRWGNDDFAEWQANSLAPRILMPKTSFQLVTEQCKRSIQRDDISLRVLANMAIKTGGARPLDWLVAMLADFYHVSKQSALLRLRDLGDPWYEEREDKELAFDAIIR